MNMETLILIYVIALIALILLLVYLNCCIVIVKQGTKKVVERLGVYRRTLNAGFHFIIKPIDKIAPVPWEVFSKREQFENIYNKEFYRESFGLDADEDALNFIAENQEMIKVKNRSDMLYRMGKDIEESGYDYDGINRDKVKYRSLKQQQKFATKLAVAANANAGLGVISNVEIDPKLLLKVANKLSKISGIETTKAFEIVCDVLKDNSQIKADLLAEAKVDVDAAAEHAAGLIGNTASNNYDRKDNSNKYERNSYYNSGDQQPFQKFASMYDPKLAYDRYARGRLDYIDMRERFIDFECNPEYRGPQSVITKDNAVVKVDTVIFFQITDAFSYYYGANEPEKAIQLLAITTLRSMIGSLTLEETLVSRKEINTELRQTLDDATNAWGIKVNRVEIKEFILEDNVKQAMNAVLIAERRKRSTILNAEAEARRIELIRSAEALGYEKIKEASLDEAVLKVRGYEALKDVANGNATKIFLPNDISNLVVGSNLIAEAIDDKKTKVQTESEKQQPKENIEEILNLVEESSESQENA